MERRSFVKLGILSVPSLGLGQSTEVNGNGLFVRSGADRFGETHSLGFSTISFKVSSADTGGGMFTMEHDNLGKGGPNRHMHPDQDEWLFAMEGEFQVEVGKNRMILKPGDSILMPRKVPHVWAQVSDKPGKLLIAFTPAGRMEAFFRDFGKTGKLPSEAAVLSSYGIERVGPPLQL